MKLTAGASISQLISTNTSHIRTLILACILLVHYLSYHHAQALTCDKSNNLSPTCSSSQQNIVTQAELPPETSANTHAVTRSVPVTPTSASHTNDNDSLQPGGDSIDITPEQKKAFKQHVMKFLLESLNLKEAPRKPQNKAVVPRAILNEYISFREEAREYVPDDQDFYGKIDLNLLKHDDASLADIEVDMGPADVTAGAERRFHYRGEASNIKYLPLENIPDDIPRDIESHLPPYSRSTNSDKQFISVHLKFNLSQELYTRPIALDELKGAELRLSRERLLGCGFIGQPDAGACDESVLSTLDTGSETKPNDTQKRPKSNLETGIAGVTTSKFQSLRHSRYQRVYIVQITDYDSHNVPIAKLIDSRRIDTHQQTDLVFDIYTIVRYWLLHPDKVFGIIVRVTTEDETEPAGNESPAATPTFYSKPDLNASLSDLKLTMAEHVRLKRNFRFASDSDAVWKEKQPSLLIFTYSPPEAAAESVVRRHVKRDYQTGPGAGAGEAIQADQSTSTTGSAYSEENPNSSITTDGAKLDETQFTSAPSTSTSTMTYDNEQLSSFTAATVSKQPSIGHQETQPNLSPHSVMTQTVRSTPPYQQRSNIQTSTNASPSRRDNMQNRNVGRSTGTANNPRARGKVKPNKSSQDKCRRWTLTINFDEVGWSNWIIAPLTYHANYCFGDCSFPMSDHQNATNHAIIQSIFHSVGRNVPKSCCAPTKLLKLAILYSLDGLVQLRNYDDMSVEACGCL